MKKTMLMVSMLVLVTGMNGFAAGKKIVIEGSTTVLPIAQAAAEADWDAVSALESGAMKKEDIKADQLPAEVQKLDKAAREKYLDGKLAERKRIKEEINALQSQRKAYISAEEKKASGANTLDKAMIESIRTQATKRGYKFQK